MTLKECTQLNRELRKENQELQKSLVECNADLNRFREHASDRFKWWITLLKENKVPVVSWLIEQDAKFLTTVKYFSW